MLRAPLPWGQSLLGSLPGPWAPKPTQTQEGLLLHHSLQLLPFSILHLRHSLEVCVGSVLLLLTPQSKAMKTPKFPGSWTLSQP